MFRHVSNVFESDLHVEPGVFRAIGRPDEPDAVADVEFRDRDDVVSQCEGSRVHRC